MNEVGVRQKGSAVHRHLSRIDDSLRQVTGWIVATLLASATALGIYQVLARFVLKQPSTWSEALTRTLLIWMVYLGAALAVRAGLLVALDLVRSVSTGLIRKSLELASLVCSLVFFSLIAWYGYEIASLVRFQTLAGLEISIAWSYAALPVGGALAALLTFLAILRLLVDGRGDPPAERPAEGA